MTGPHRESDLEHRVEAARARLRELGYLRNPIENFVAGPAARGGALRSLGSVSIRFGLVGGVLLALTTWIAILSFNHALLDAPRDLALLAAYLLAVDVGVVTLLGILVGGILMLVSRRAVRARLGWTTTIVGACATIASFLYGTVWWHWHQFGPDIQPLAWVANLLAGLLIVVVALVMGRLARLWTALVLAEGGGPRPAAAHGRHREAWRVLTAGIAAAALLVAYLYATTPRTRETHSAASPFTIDTPARALVIIGIDGLSWEDFFYLAKGGHVPILSKLVERGVRAPLAGAQGTEPPELWTTIATGEPAARHGVQTFVQARLAGMRRGFSLPHPRFGTSAAFDAVFPEGGLARRVPVSGVTRRRKALWEIVAEKGVPAAAVNWWATWPADESPAVIVSERAFARLSSPRAAPASLTRALAPLSLESFADSIATRALADTLPSERDLAAAERRSARLAVAGDHFALGAAQRFATDVCRNGLLAFYLPGLDILRRHAPAQPQAASLASADVRLRVVCELASRIDAGVGTLLEAAGDSAVVALIVTPGGARRPDAAINLGLFALASREVQAATVAREILPEEIAPTLLVSLGFPVSREMSGRARTDLFSDSARAQLAVSVIESFGDRGHADAGSTPYDDEFIERLRSLGYIQ